LQHEIDTGNILMQKSFSIGEDETAGEVHDRMQDIGAELLVKTVEGLIDGSLQEIKQEQLTQHDTLKHAPKIFTETCEIHWDKSAEEIHNLIRGLSPYPAAFTFLQGKTLKIFRSQKEITKPSIQTGAYNTDGKSFLKFACADGYIHALDIQLEGKKKMTISDFLRGFRFE